MGTLTHFSMAAIVDRYEVRHFVETGAGEGDGLAHAAKCRAFEKLRSCEYEPSLYEKTVVRFRYDKRVVVYNATSGHFLDMMLGGIPKDEPILFWLDAHFPGADYRLKGYGDEHADRVRIPLPTELEMISAHRPYGRDIIICDDARIFMDGPYRYGNLPIDLRPHCPVERGLDFIPRAFEYTHDRTVLWDHEGYIVMTPKGVPWT